MNKFFIILKITFFYFTIHFVNMLCKRNGLIGIITLYFISINFEIKILSNIALLLSIIQIVVFIMTVQLNNYLVINRFTGSLYMNVYLDKAEIERVMRREGYNNRAKFLAKKFEEGIKEIKYLKRYFIPALWFAKSVKVSTNESIYVNYNNNQINPIKTTKRMILDKVFFMKPIKLIHIIFCTKKGRTYYKYLSKELNYYKIKIPLDKI